jgi:hypothetical protein
MTTSCRDRLRALQGDDGSTIPLVLGFWLIALLFVGGGIAASDAFSKQQDLQSVCDSAAIVAANSIPSDTVHGGGVGSSEALPLDRAGTEVRALLDREPDTADVAVSGNLSTDGTTVNLSCTEHNRIAFGALIGKPGGINQTAEASARSPIAP